jgi:hypothetical protein
MPTLLSSRPLPEPMTAYLNVPHFRQQRSLSCEMAALRMAAAFQGLAKSETELVQILPMDNTQPTTDKGRVIWVDADRVFAGNIRGWQFFYGGLSSYPKRARQGAWGYGVHALGIAEVATRLGLEAQVFDTVEHVFAALARGNPVVVIVPCSGKSTSREWTWHTRRGDAVHVINSEHAVTVRGFGERRVLVNDPLGGVASYTRGVFQRAFELMKNGVEIGPPRKVVPAPNRIADHKLPWGQRPPEIG